MTLLHHPAVSCRMFFVLLGLFWAGLVVGQEAAVQDRFAAEDRFAAQDRFDMRVSTGYQREDLRWSIAGNSAGRNPNVYSELKWKGVSGAAAGVDVSWRVWRHWVLSAGGSRMFTSSGRVSDTDYSGDDRTSPVYGMSFDSHKGYAYSSSVGVGYRWEIGRCLLTPVVGYGWSGQRLSIEDGGSLNSYYRTSWKGPVVKLSGDWKLGDRLGVLLGVDYHQVDYRAEADWNLIQQFRHPVSFRHWGEGYGVGGEMEVKYRISKLMSLVAGGRYFYWRTGTGVDELYLASGQKSQTQLNEVVLKGFGLNAGVRLGW